MQSCAGQQSLQDKIMLFPSASRDSFSPFDEISIPIRLRNPNVLKKISNCSLEAKVKGTYVDPFSVHGESTYEVDGLVYRTRECLVLSFQPQHEGQHKVRIYCDGDDFGPCIQFRVNSDGKAVVEGSGGGGGGGPGGPQRTSQFYRTLDGHGSNSTDMSSAASSVHYGTVGRVQSTTAVPQWGTRSAFHMNYLAPHARSQMDVSNELEDAGRIQQQKRTANLLTFSELHKLKRIGLEDSFMEPPKEAELVATMKHGMATMETLKMLQEEAELIASPRGAKKRCQLCTHRHKAHKFTRVWNTDLCDLCLKLNYTQHSFIEHFMVPTVQDAAIVVPLDRRGKKTLTATKRLPVANFRGLSPAEVRYAQGELKKFDIDGIGWVDKAVLLPLVKAVFSYRLKESEIKVFLSSPSLKAMLANMGLELRDHVHEIEFLSVVAFVAREIQMALPSKSPYTRFTQQDLEMAYTFQMKYGMGNVPDQVQGASKGAKGAESQQVEKSKTRKVEISPASATSVNKRDSALSSKVPTSQSFEWQASPDPSPHQDKHKPRPPSSSPIYEAIPEQLTLQKSGGGGGGGGGGKGNPNRASLIYEKVDQPSKPYSRPRQPQPPVLPVYKHGLSRKGVSPEKTSRLAPIGGVTKLNPLLDEQNEVGSGTVEQGEGQGEAELPTQALEDLKLTGGAADGWMLY